MCGQRMMSAATTSMLAPTARAASPAHSHQVIRRTPRGGRCRRRERRRRERVAVMVRTVPPGAVHAVGSSWVVPTVSGVWFSAGSALPHPALHPPALPRYVLGGRVCGVGVSVAGTSGLSVLLGVLECRLLHRRRSWPGWCRGRRRHHPGPRRLAAGCDGDVPVGGLFVLLGPAASHPGCCSVELVDDVGVRCEE